jgi:hypothetical protein
VIKAASRRTARAGLMALAVVCGTVGLGAAGCGTAAPAGTARPPVPVKPLSLATSVTTGADSWAVALLGGSAAQYNNFWQVLVRPAGSATWRLVTPPGVASNGGLLIAPESGSSLVAGFRPSQLLTFTPLASTSTAGATWSAGVMDAALADVPDALAADPATGRLLALLADGSVELSNPAGTSWTTIASKRTLTGGLAARRCGLGNLTGVAFGVSGVPLVAGNCDQRGVAGIFGYAAGHWQAAGPALPPAFAHEQISVLAIAASAGRLVTLLQAGLGAGAGLMVAGIGGSGWSVSAPAPLSGRTVLSAAIGDSGTVGVVLTGGRGLIVAGAGSSWQSLPSLPRQTQTLSLGPGAQVQALAPGRTTVLVWDYAARSASWAIVQKLRVPIEFGSSD